MRVSGGLSGVVLALAIATAAPAVAQLQPQTANGVTWVSGGVGDDEHAALQAMREQFRLRLLFAVDGSGEYLADVWVGIVDAQGRSLLETVAQGPYFFADLPPGRYRVTASSARRPITRMVTVPATGAVEERFFWPAS